MATPPGQDDARDRVDTDYIVVQGENIDSLVGDRRKELEDLGVEFHQYMGENAYLCRFTQRDLGPLKSKTYIQHVGAYNADYKVAFSLQPAPVVSERTMRVAALTTSAAASAAASAPLQDPLEVRIVMQKDSKQSASDLAKTLIQRGIIKDSDTYVYDNSFETNLPQAQLQGLAANESVRAIEPVYEEVDDLNISRTILNLPEQVLQINANGAAGVIGCQGQGETVHVADSGFDTGDMNNYHAAFQNRCVAMFALTRTGRINNPTAAQLAGSSSHGTHVAGCAVASGVQSTMLGPGGVLGGQIRGPAPEAQLIVTKMNASPSGRRFRGDCRMIWDEPYNRNSRISNHSYGPAVDDGDAQIPYGDTNEVIDNYIFNHPDLVVTWSAGNSGRTQNPAAQVNGRSCSKNVITIGSCLSSRRVTNGKYDENAPERDTFSVAPSSSRGPALIEIRGPVAAVKHRQKPDLCAPGSIILAPKALNIDDDEAFGVSRDPTYLFMAGTSMAAPHGAGCAALLRQALRNRQVADPSAALIKALLINGAVDIERGTGPSAIPSNTQGFGRINVQGSMDMVLRQTDLDQTKRAWGGFWDAKPNGGTAPGSLMRPVDMTHNASANITIFTPELIAPGGDSIGRTLKVTLVWTDMGGAPLVNWLGLAVRSNPSAPVDGGPPPPSRRRHGNIPGDQPNDASTTYDDVNNVQQVLWEDIPAGTADIIVTCLLMEGSLTEVGYAVAYSLE